METIFTELAGGEKKGWIEVICGSMFSGKTEELIRRLKRVEIANKRACIFKPVTDKRFDAVKVVSHDANFVQSTPVESAESILLLAGGVDVIGIDEAQFFDAGLPEVCEKLAKKGVRVIVAGLDMDYEGRPFGPVPALLAIADYVTKLHAICVKCGDIAHFSFRKINQKDIFLLGERQEYEPRCRRCFYLND
jgi:thymidine kinase